MYCTAKPGTGNRQPATDGALSPPTLFEGRVKRLEAKNKIPPTYMDGIFGGTTQI